jgi:hypothetical protein
MTTRATGTATRYVRGRSLTEAEETATLTKIVKLTAGSRNPLDECSADLQRSVLTAPAAHNPSGLTLEDHQAAVQER